MKKLYVILFSILLVFISLCTTAQVSTNTSGAVAIGSGGTVSYSIGQIIFHTETGPNISIGEGIQQPFEISIFTGAENTHIGLSLSAYPNPTTDFLNLNIKQGYNNKLTLSIIDINGRLIDTRQISSEITQIDMGKYSPASYFLQVRQNNTILKSFKVIKQ